MTWIPYAQAPAPELMLLTPCRACRAPQGQRCGHDTQSPLWGVIVSMTHWHAARVEDATARAYLIAP